MVRNKILSFCGILVVSIVIIAAFVTSTSYIQLGVASVLYILFVYFIFKALPKKTIKIQVAEVAPILKEEKGVIDINKRDFLKMIGGVGVSLFLLSIFNKKSQNLLFKNMGGGGAMALEDTNGNLVDPAQNHPTDGYRITEVDDNIVSYFGFTNKDGGWFIMRQDASDGSFRYARGDNNFPGYWPGRESIKYDYYANVF